VKTAPVTLEELAKLSSYWDRFSRLNHTPSPRDQLVAELRGAGYVAAGETLDGILRASEDRSKLDQPMPDDMVERIWATIGPLRFYEKDGHLRWASASSAYAPYSSAQAIDKFGMKLVVQASAERYGAPIPAAASQPDRADAADRRLAAQVHAKPRPAWQRVSALRVHVWRRVPKPVAISLILLFAPLWVPASLAIDPTQTETNR